MRFKWNVGSENFYCIVKFSDPSQVPPLVLHVVLIEQLQYYVNACNDQFNFLIFNRLKGYVSPKKDAVSKLFMLVFLWYIW